MNPIEQTRIHMSEHSYPTPTRNHLSMHNREASKRRMYGATRGSEVRIGISTRTPIRNDRNEIVGFADDGVTVMALTDSEIAQARDEELANIRMDAQLRADRIRQRLAGHITETDSWAHKV